MQDRESNQSSSIIMYSDILIIKKQILRVLGTNSLFMSMPVAMDSISKTRAARRTQFVAV